MGPGVLNSRSLIQILVSVLVADKPPKPSLSAWPSTMFKLRKAITLQHRVPHPVLEFSLEWEERATFQKFLVDGDFIISNAEGKGTETYSCSYRIEAHPNIWSDRSEPLKLMGPAGERTTLPRVAPPWLWSCYPWDPEAVPRKLWKGESGIVKQGPRVWAHFPWGDLIITQRQ